jgi:D-arabinose 1-dehydrogenase-like Zn-dependent alcohol dehydrogenase
VGEIVEVGDGVVSRKIGDRVGLPWGCELLADIASGACAAKANFAGIL